jgi:MOSC domain-containing protein YiiM
MSGRVVSVNVGRPAPLATGRELPPASFGENLMLAGVDVSGARIGERWRIGSAELRVTGPRVPCFKLEARIGVHGFQRAFLLAGRPGAYLTIVEEGELEAARADMLPKLAAWYEEVAQSTSVAP